MKISKLALIALLGGALMSFGCSSDSNGTAGTGGDGGGGAGGDGGGGGAGPMCVPTSKMCGNAMIEPIELDETCNLVLPAENQLCTGGESLENPATCAAGDGAVVITITELKVPTETVDVEGVEEQWGQCNNGYDLDGCDGNSCIPGMLAPGEGEEAVDNALAGLAPVLAGVDGNLGGVNQAFYDGLCSGDIAIAFSVDANDTDGCATVQVLSDGEATGDSFAMNLSETGCLSGTIGSIPLNVGGESGMMANAVIRATLTESELSNGSLGATVDQATAVAIAEALLEGAGPVVGQVLDINDTLSNDASQPCNALSLELFVGGVALEAVPQ